MPLTLQIMHSDRRGDMFSYLYKSVLRLLLTTVMILAGPNALAHLMPAQQGTVNILDDAAFIVFSVPVSALVKSDNKIDDNHDNRLSEAELQLHRVAIEQLIKQRLRMFDDKDQGRVDFIQISTEPSEFSQHTDIDTRANTIGATQFLVLMKIRFNATPKTLRIETDLFGTLENEQQFTIKAIRGQEIEAIILRAKHPQHQFFRGPWQVFTDYIVIGCEHILLGFDHLLFLLTIIVATAGWRYWLGVLTSFTIAHSVTLTLSLMGWVHAPAKIIEPLIAASIVLMAVLNLWQRHAAVLQRFSVVFACGLLHGLGFASSITDMGLHGSYRLMSLLGFNLGIELGQALFLLLLLALGTVLHQLARITLSNRLNLTELIKPMTSISALIIGTAWIFERLIIY